MGWKTMAAAVVLLTAASTTPAMAAETPHWQVTLLPMPADVPNALAYLNGADGHGGYVGTIGTDDRFLIVRWHCGEVVVQPGPPNGNDYPRVNGESRDGTVLVDSFTLDRAGVYHPVSTGPWRYAGPSKIGPRGDLLGAGDDPVTLSPVVLYWPSPSAEPVVLTGALPGSWPTAIDDDGTVLLGHPDGPYLLHDGVVRKLALPEGYRNGRADAIRHGVVVGAATPTDGPGDGGLVWASPDSPQVLPNSRYAQGLNSHGLVVGGDSNGTTAAWQDGQELGPLPGPDGLPKVFSYLVDDDGAIPGEATPATSGLGYRVAVWRPTTG
ncbi:hypothetical protein [Kutzneria chonburiensis]|uniref:Uncharacterized protein n=1 Tax=Kutzneria chonburiensis TaxID=1483604 RepID=A0ABV6MMJ1_9PSEU|nr:hypothetical protein [Kutzneria chonburiensis]